MRSRRGKEERKSIGTNEERKDVEKLKNKCGKEKKRSEEQMRK